MRARDTGAIAHPCIRKPIEMARGGHIVTRNMLGTSSGQLKTNSRPARVRILQHFPLQRPGLNMTPDFEGHVSLTETRKSLKVPPLGDKFRLSDRWPSACKAVIHAIITS